jgi:hypothetical protein
MSEDTFSIGPGMGISVEAYRQFVARKGGQKMRTPVLAMLAGLALRVGAVQADNSMQRIHAQVLAQAATDGRVTIVQLAPGYSTAIRMHEPVSSVVVGDPTSFLAEHHEKEPNLVFVKPITAKPSQTNLLISTVLGHQVSVLLISRGEVGANERPAIDLLVSSRPARRFLIEPSDHPSALTAETTSLNESGSTAVRTVPLGKMPEPSALAAETEQTALGQLLERQQRAALPKLYGGKPGISEPEKERIEAGVSEVIDQGRAVVVLFSVVNPQGHAIELMPPQIQLGGKVRSGWLFKRSKWSTAEQFPILDYRLSRRRLGPQERADGVVLFERPPYKQSNETLFLQIAESGAVDRPALAPIGFGISDFDLSRGGSHGRASGQE